MKKKVDELMRQEALRVNAEVQRKKIIELKKKLTTKLQHETVDMEKRMEKVRAAEVMDMVTAQIVEQISQIKSTPGKALYHELRIKATYRFIADIRELQKGSISKDKRIAVPTNELDEVAQQEQALDEKKEAAAKELQELVL